MRYPNPLALAFLAGLFLACSGSESSVTPDAELDFVVQSSEVGSVVKLNQPISLQFSLPVDFSTVGSNTIRISTASGVPASGSFAFGRSDRDGDGISEIDTRTIVFQPSCPIEPDGRDAGFLAGESYTLEIRGGGAPRPAVLLSESGQPLVQDFTRSFAAASGSLPEELFEDTKIGPPLPLIRDAGSTDPISTYVQAGEGERIYFEFDEATGSVTTNPADYLSPLNLYSDPSSRMNFSVWFDQAIDPSRENLGRITMQFLGGDHRYHGLDTKVELLSNCGEEGGALVRVSARGVFPQGGEVRLNVEGGFRDITGEVWVNSLAGFAQLRTEQVDFESLVPSDVLGDEVLASFDHAAPMGDSLQDPGLPLDGAAAEWGEGVLRSSSGFEGDGGPNGTFDWHVLAGELVFFDTNFMLIIGGEDGVPESRLLVENGNLSVRNIRIEQGARVRVQGPNPLNIYATGTVDIQGELDISGFNGRDVATINTGNLPEPGGSGTGGGGSGGTASLVTDSSTPRGGMGEGPFRELGRGGQGGESGFAPKALGKDARRPGGGGGGRFAPDTGELQARAGFDGHPMSTGAESGTMPAAGGRPNDGPFTDGRPENDYYGVAPLLDGDGNLVGRLVGELQRPWAGAGGGAGGDALPSSQFPTPGWGPASDEKGGPGGGGAGRLWIRALGPIVIGPQGVVRAVGGRGGVGENTLFLDHVGGTGGSGSGGHVILESASSVEIQGSANTALLAEGGPVVIGPLADIPPNISYGGSGGPGIIQIHVPGPEQGFGATADEADLILPEASNLDDPLGRLSSPRLRLLYPTFGGLSAARSRWLTLGAADQAADGTEELVSFLFLGTELASGPDEGRVLTDGDGVVELPSFFPDGVIDGQNARVSLDGLSLLLREDALAFGSSEGLFADVYVRTPELLEHFGLELFTDTALRQEFLVESASYDDGAAELAIRIDFNGTSLRDFLKLAGIPVSYRLIPRFFRVNSSLGRDRLPQDTSVRVLFQGATRDEDGRPDLTDPLVDWTGDIRRFNALDRGALDFFRFRVEFDVPLGADPVEMEFLRVPFRF